MRFCMKRSLLFGWGLSLSLALGGVGLADDGKNGNDKASASSTSTKSIAPGNLEPGLTDRERWLLDRVEQLERRVAELEAKEGHGEVATVAAKPAEARASAPAVKSGGEVAGSASVNSATSAAPAGTVMPGAAAGISAESSSSAALAGNVEPAIGPKQDNGKPSNPTPQKTKIEPFSDADWTWLNGNARTKEIFWDTKFFTPEIRADIHYVYDFNHPEDHSMGGSSELFRTNEVQLEQLGVGGDFHYDNVRARLMTQFGMYSATTPRNDPSPGHGQWDLFTAYRYVSEAYGGYHFDVWHGINVDAGIFMSYVGLFSYYNFDNWAYQPSYVSSNTPWFFNGVRVQIFPTAHLKIEPWFINGWQSYASANHKPGLGGQIKWTPRPWINIISNNYGLGEDDLFVKGRSRIHTDNSIEVKYYDNQETPISKMAFTLTGDLGCEYGSGVSCYGNHKGGPKQSFVGWMGYNRFWFHRDLFAVTVGGGQINNPGRYLVLIPPINGASALSAATNAPYFTGNPGDPFKAWDSSVTFDYMPRQYITFRAEYDYRHANVPYWTGQGGITPPGGNNSFPQYFACSSGASSGQTTLAAAVQACGGGVSSVWFPDLRKNESFIDLAILVKF